MNRARTILRLLPAFAMIFCWAVASLALEGQTVVLTIDQPQTAGISGFRAMWDTPVVLRAGGVSEEVDNGNFGKAPSAIWSPAKRDNGARPGALAFDAVHRSLLVCFPAAAQQIADMLARGYTIQKVELALPYTGTELWPEGYDVPAGMSFLGDTWTKSTPRWHAIAWVICKPWQADSQSGPTFNAYINGVGYWKQFGAQDTTADRFPKQFGPEEVSAQHPDGRMDVTPVLTSNEYGASLAERLRVLAYQGFLLRKWETYDAALWQGGYEWATARGPQGILIATPKLIITLAPGPATRIAPDALAFDAHAYIAKLAADHTGGSPTAVLPTAEQLTTLSKRLGFNKPAEMPDWQWQRVRELQQKGGSWEFPATPDAYNKWIDGMLSRAPRSWYGFDAAEVVQTYYKYYDALPEPVREHWKNYWKAWLMPDRDAAELVHGYIGGREAQAYYQKTGDWRGNFSVYRTYCYNMGTMNFNHWNTAGTLMGGAMLGSERLVNDGRHGLEQWPLRTWCWYDGSTQESIDHYYFGITLKDQKVFADFGPTHFDRMMGQSILAKSIEELASSFHPGLRRFISSSGRTGINYLLCQQDGLQAIMHTLSRKGAYTDFEKSAVTAPNVDSSPVFGHDFQPGLAAQLTLNGPWAPAWMANLVDDKPLPYEMTVNYKQWGAFDTTPLWRRTYMGKNYGMASLDVSAGNETVPVMAQWRRQDAVAQSMTDLGTLIVRPGINRTELLDSIYHDINHRNPNGSVGVQGSTMATLQQKNKMIVLASPLPKLQYNGGRPVPKDLFSLQTTIGLFNFQGTPTWELFVDGRKVTQLPYTMKYGQHITIKDGVSYIGIIPLPATDLGRDADVVITDDGRMTEMQGGGKAREALRINAYIMKRNTPVTPTDAEWQQIDLAYGGYVIEMGDNAEYANFAAFQQHIADARLATTWNQQAHTLAVKYTSGKDTMECGYRTDYAGDWDHKVPTDQCFPYRRVNGQWPYLPAGINRDSTCSRQGTTGTLTKQGAMLHTEVGHMGYLLAEPQSGEFIGMNPFPDLTAWSLDVPGGIRVSADGKLGITRVVVSPRQRTLTIDHGFRPTETDPAMATAMLAFGFTAPPTVTLNGVALTDLATVKIDGKTAYVIPLGEKSNAPMNDLPARYKATQALLGGK